MTSRPHRASQRTVPEADIARGIRERARPAFVCPREPAAGEGPRGRHPGPPDSGSNRQADGPSSPAREPDARPARARRSGAMRRRRAPRKAVRGLGARGRGVRGALRRTGRPADRDRKSTRLNSSHSQISYAVFCLKKKNQHHNSNLKIFYHLGDLATVVDTHPSGYLPTSIFKSATHRYADSQYKRNTP